MVLSHLFRGTVLSVAVQRAFYLGAAGALAATAMSAHAQEVSSDTAVSTLPTVQVTGEGQAETATGPVRGYRASRSATATKTDTPLAETPQSVTVVTQDQIRDQGATNLQDALTYAAGVRSNAYGLDSRADSMSVRGTNPVVYTNGLRQTNGYYTSTTRPDPYTMERIEVLRGPSAMLYGQGSTGGVVNLVSKRPLDTFQGEVGVQVGNFGRRQLQADISGPLTESGEWLYRLVSVIRHSDTQVDYVNDDRYLIEPSLTWRPNAATSLTLQASVQRDKSGSTSQFLPWSGMLTSNPNGQVPSSRFIGEPSDRYDTDRQSVGYMLEHRFNDQWTVRQNARYAENTVDYFSHYGRGWTGAAFALDPINQRRIGRDADYSITNVKALTLDQHIEGKLQTGGVQHTVLMGLDFNRYQTNIRSQYAGNYDTIDIYNPVYGNALPVNLSAEPSTTQRQTGLYLQDQMKIHDKWIVVAGLRHDRVVNAQEGSADNRDRATTKRLGLMYLLDSGWSPYISYSESFTPLAGTDRQGMRYQPLEGRQVEAGVKYAPADGKSQFTAAVWRIKEKNRQATDPQDARFSLQVARAESQGLELEWRGDVTKNFDVIAHYNYLDQDAQLTATPKHQAAMWGKWRFNIADVQNLSFGTGVRYMSSFTDRTAPTTPSVTLLDMMLSWENGPWRYALNVNNVTDKLYNAACLARGDCWYGARRTAVASATYRF